MCPGGGRVQSGAPWGSSDSLGRTLGVVGFFGVGRVGSGVLGVVELIRILWVCSVVPWGSSGSFGFVRFVRVCPSGRRFHSGLLNLFRYALGVVRVIWALPAGCRVHSDSLSLFGLAVGVVGFIRARWILFGVP